jgi:crotonobetainyl-CoA:carnitine CoA-transferase CaiB-like acyl-CoA transferase
MVGTMGFQAVRYLNGGDVPPPAGNHHPINAPYGVFKARDGYLTIGATGPKRWPLFCRLLDAEDWLDDPRFASIGGRHEHRLALAALIENKLKARGVDEWECLFNDAGIPAGPVYAMDRALDHPPVRHREMVIEQPHPTLGTVSLLGLPVKLRDTPGAVQRIPPDLGEHTDEILDELGLGSEDRDQLRQQGIV